MELEKNISINLKKEGKKKKSAKEQFDQSFRLTTALIILPSTLFSFFTKASTSWNAEPLSQKWS